MFSMFLLMFAFMSVCSFSPYSYLALSCSVSPTHIQRTLHTSPSNPPYPISNMTRRRSHGTRKNIGRGRVSCIGTQGGEDQGEIRGRMRDRPGPGPAQGTVRTTAAGSRYVAVTGRWGQVGRGGWSWDRPEFWLHFVHYIAFRVAPVFQNCSNRRSRDGAPQTVGQGGENKHNDGRRYDGEGCLGRR